MNREEWKQLRLLSIEQRRKRQRELERAAWARLIKMVLFLVGMLALIWLCMPRS